MPGNDNQRVGMIAAQKQQIVFAHPSLKRGEAVSVFSRLDLGNQRRGIRPCA